MSGIRCLGAGVALAATLAGCGGGGGDELLVYSSLPGGGANVRAQQLALAEAGGKAGKFKIRLVSLDNEKPEIGFADPKRAVRNARRAVNDDRAIAYIGEGPSDSTAASLPILNRAGLLMVTPFSSYVGLTRREGAQPGEPGKYYPSDRRTLGRMIPADNVQAAALVEYMVREGVRKAAVIHDSSKYGIGLAQLFANRMRGSAIALDGRPRGFRTGGEGTQYADPDDEVAEAASRGVDGILVAANIPPGLAAQLARAAPEAKLFLPDSAAASELAAAVKGVEDRIRITSPPEADRRTSEQAKAFAESFESRFGEAPGPQTAYAYECMRLILAAIERAGERGDDRGAVVRAFFSLRNRQSPLGRYSITATGDTTLDSYGAYRVENGKLVADRPLGGG